MTDFLRIPLDTKLGQVVVVPTDADHIHVNGDLLTVNTVTYRASFHVYRQADGTFAPKSYQDLYLRRTPLCVNDYPSASATKKTTAVLTAAVNAWVTAHPQVLAQAQTNHLADEIAKRNETIIEKRQAIAQLEAEIAALVAQRGAHEAVIYGEVK